VIRREDIDFQFAIAGFPREAMLNVVWGQFWLEIMLAEEGNDLA